MASRGAFVQQAVALGSDRHAQARCWYALTWLRHRPLVAAAVMVLMAMVVVAVLAPVLAPRDPYAIAPRDALQPPRAGALFGTDRFGRDVLSRVIYGARNSLIIAIGAVGISATIGGLLGLAGGYRGGFVDILIGRLMDVLFSFPALLLAIAIAAILTPGLRNAIIAIAVVYIPLFSRVVRGPVITESNRDYVEAARVSGASDKRVLFRHIVPNVVSPWLVQVSVGFSHAILLEAALSYLGLGMQPPAPSWGGMLREARDFLSAAPWLSIFPGLAIMLTVLAFNILGDGLRDAIDPTTR